MYASGSIPVTIANHAAPPSIVQSIAGGQTLKGTVTWTATPSAPVSQVVFALDGNKITHADATAPYEYVLDTTKLANGAHTFGLTVTLLDGSVVWQPYQVGSVTINNPNSTPPAVTQLSSTTNIKAGQVLKGTVHWTVQASGKAHAVTFYNNQVFLTQVVADGNNWAFNLDTTQFADGATKLGYDIYNAAGERVFDGTSISVTINNTGAGGGSSGGGGGSGSGGSTPTIPSTPTTPTTGSLRPTTPPALPAPKPQPNKALRLVSGGFALTPNTAIAGHTFGAAMFVVRSDTGKRITGAKIKAKATVGGKPLSLVWKGWYRTAAGATWRIPTGTTGKTFVGSLTVTWRGTTLTNDSPPKSASDSIVLWILCDNGVLDSGCPREQRRWTKGDGMKSGGPNRFDFLGLRFDNVTLSESVARVVEFIASGEPHAICALNAELIVRAQSDEWLCGVYENADLVTVDSYVVGYGARMCGRPLKEPVNGARLMLALLPVASERGFRVFLLGATEEVVNAVAARIGREYPGIVIAGWRDGYFDLGDDGDVVESIRASNADLLFVAMSSPLKERFISKNLAALDVPVCLGVGGTFDILAGKTKQAPEWLSKLCLEWLYRFIQEPRRLWKRYFTTNPRFLRLLAREWLHQHRTSTQ